MFTISTQIHGNQSNHVHNIISDSSSMSELGHLLIAISNKLSKMISRTNKLERNVYKFVKIYESQSNTAGGLPDKQI